jgi:hypothetical protein
MEGRPALAGYEVLVVRWCHTGFPDYVIVGRFTGRVPIDQPYLGDSVALETSDRLWFGVENVPNAVTREERE